MEPAPPRDSMATRLWSRLRRRSSHRVQVGPDDRGSEADEEGEAAPASAAEGKGGAEAPPGLRRTQRTHSAPDFRAAAMEARAAAGATARAPATDRDAAEAGPAIQMQPGAAAQGPHHSGAARWVFSDNGSGPAGAQADGGPEGAARLAAAAALRPALRTNSRELGPRSQALRVLSAPSMTRAHHSTVGPLRITFSSAQAAGRHTTGHAKLCQDACIMHTHLLRRDVHLFGVIDAHGPHGTYVATALRRELPRRLVTRLRGSLDQLRVAAEPWSACADARAVRSSLMHVSRVMQVVMSDAQSALARDPAIDVTASGAAVHMVLLVGVHTFVVNVGNCNSVLCQPRAAVSSAAWALSTPHTPDVPSERARIEECGGTVREPPHELLAPGLPHDGRPWLLSPGDDPAVRMRLSRSLGDFQAAAWGLIYDPVVTYGFLGLDGPSVIVLGSDGVWDVLRPADVADMVAAAQRAELADAAGGGGQHHSSGSSNSSAASAERGASPLPPTSPSGRAALAGPPAAAAAAAAARPGRSALLTASVVLDEVSRRWAAPASPLARSPTRGAAEGAAVASPTSPDGAARASGYVRDRAVVVVVLQPQAEGSQFSSTGVTATTLDHGQS